MSFLTSTLLYFIPPLAISLLFFGLLLHNLRTPTLPHPQPATHFLLALLLAPLTSLSAQFWLMQPLFLTFLLPILLVQLILSVPLAYLTYTFSQLIFLLVPLFSSFVSALSYLPTATFSPTLESALKDLLSAFLSVIESFDPAGLFNNIILPENATIALENLDISLNSLSHHELNQIFTRAPISNATTKAFSQALNAMGLLISSYFSDVLSQNLTPKSRTSLSDILQNLQLLSSSISVSDLLSNSSLPEDLVDSFFEFQQTFYDVLHAIDVHDIFSSTKAPQNARDAFENVIFLLRDSNTSSFFQTLQIPPPTVPSFPKFVWSLSRDLTAGKILLGIFLLLSLVPLLFFLRSFLHEMAKWLLSRRYTNVATRDARGWLLTACLSALGVATAESVVSGMFVACLEFILGPDNTCTWALLVHVISIVPIQVAVQACVARAAIRADVFGRPAGGVTKTFLKGVGIMAMVNIWWDCYAGVLVLCGVLWKWGVLRLVVVDVGVFIAGVVWVRNVCKGVIEEERVELEARERKDD